MVGRMAFNLRRFLRGFFGVEATISFMQQIGVWKFVGPVVSVFVAGAVSLWARWSDAVPYWGMAILFLGTFAIVMFAANQVITWRTRRRHTSAQTAQSYARRRQLIDDCRDAIARYAEAPEGEEFKRFLARQRCILEVLPYLSENTRKALVHGRLVIGDPGGGFLGGLELSLLRDLDRLERDWDLK